jgi:hypothetical protein
VEPKGAEARAQQNNSVEQAIAEKDMSWQLLLRISGSSTLEGDENAAVREFAQRYLAQATDVYREQWNAEVALFPPIGGICVHGNGDFTWTFHRARIRFDWSKAWDLAYRIESLTEEAKEWWPEEKPVKNGAWLARLSRWFREAVGSASGSEARRSHANRAFGLATWVMGAIKGENERHGADQGFEAPGPAFEADIANYRNEFDNTHKRFLDAVQRKAQSRYWQGAMAGIFCLAILTTVLGIVFWSVGASAYYAIALPAGGLGAIVSLLQRMSSGKLILDVDASRDLLELFGVVRPLIGAVFGLAVTALLIGGLFPGVSVPSKNQLAFFAAVGFLAGFNERWAQDMLKSSADQVSR